MKDRLDVLNITSAFARHSFEEGLVEAIEEHKADKFAKQLDQPEWARKLRFLQSLDYRRLQLALYTMAQHDIRPRDDPSRAKGDRAIRPLIEAILTSRDDTFLFFGSDMALIRAYLEAVPGVREVRLDCNEILRGGYYGSADHQICAEARRASLTERSILAPTVILTEGSTDTRYLREALATLYAHLTDYYTFFDFDARTGGGNDTLCKMVRAFVGAGMPMQMVVLFDNDAAGHTGLKSLERLSLPPNFRVMPYPDIDLARSYPTIGPQGLHAVDVNGQACSIELYLGRDALTGRDGRLRPVEWTSRDQKLGRYQGKAIG